jgi:hypothetical protein
MLMRQELTRQVHIEFAIVVKGSRNIAGLQMSEMMLPDMDLATDDKTLYFKLQCFIPLYIII